MATILWRKSMQVTFKVFLLSSVIVLASGGAKAAPLNVADFPNGIHNMSMDEAYNGNTGSGFNGYGIYADGSVGTINTNGRNLTANGNQSNGIYVLNAGSLTITGTPLGTSTLQANNNKNAAGTSGEGIYVIGAGAELNLSNMNIEASGNGLHGIYAQNGGSIEIMSTSGANSLIVKDGANSNGRGVYAVGNPGASINIRDMNVSVLDSAGAGIYAIGAGNSIDVSSQYDNDVILSGIGSSAAWARNGALISFSGVNISALNNGGRALAVDGGSTLEVIGSASKKNMILEKNNPLGAMVSAGNGSKITIKNMNISASENTLANVRDKAIFNLANSDVYMDTGDKIFITDNSVSINLTDVTFLGSDVFLETGNSLGAAADVDVSAANSNLVGSISTIEDIATNVTLTDTVWRTIGQSNITNYIASNASVYMDVFFGDELSSDKLTIEGTSSGDTILYVNSIGTDGEQTDVLVVDQSAASSAEASFSLYGGVVDSGAYEYELAKGGEGDNNWYLQSNGVMTGTARTIANIPAVHLSIVKTGMNELRKRLGELRNNGPEAKNGAWVRTYAKNLRVDDSAVSKMNLYGVEVGYDAQVYGDSEHKVYAGIMAGYLYTDDIKTKLLRSKSTAHANTPSIGAYATWLHKEGWFMDATLREFWSGMKATNYTAQGSAIHYDPDRNFTTASLEIGRQLRYDSWTLEPKAEISYAHSKAKSFNTNTGNKLHYGESQSLATRAAFKVGHDIETEKGSVLEPFVEIGTTKEWKGTTDIVYAHENFKSDVNGWSYDIALGLNGKLDENWNVYSDITYEFGSVYDGLGANFGVRYNW